MLGVVRRVLAEYPCLLDGLPAADPMIAESFGADGDPALNLNIVVTLPPRNPYVPGDQPAYADQSGPDCRGLADIDGADRRGAERRVLLPGRPASTASTPPTARTTGNPNCLGGRGPDDVPPGAR